MSDRLRCTMGVPGSSLQTIRTVHSHVHALGQCRRVIRELGLVPVISGDTAGAAREISELVDPTQAAIAPALASAAPQDEQVVSGEATFTRDGALTLITTTTPQTIVNYSSFDIGLGEACERMERQQARLAGACAGKPDVTWLEKRESRHGCAQTVAHAGYPSR